jgi:type II secretory pathway pseudopilin PulG
MAGTGRGRIGITLVEVLVTLAVIALVSVPLFQTMTTGRKIEISASDRILAMNLASSWISSVVALPGACIEAFLPVEDLNVEGPLSLKSLGILPCPDGWNRIVSIEELPSSEKGALVFHISVTIEWLNKNSDKPLSFKLNRLLSFRK